MSIDNLLVVHLHNSIGHYIPFVPFVDQTHHLSNRRLAILFLIYP
nr:MAG TPA: hypothetical protein [Caudoviricetes sp.]